jgi:hypothetical protein
MCPRAALAACPRISQRPGSEDDIQPQGGSRRDTDLVRAAVVLLLLALVPSYRSDLR